MKVIERNVMYINQRKVDNVAAAVETEFRETITTAMDNFAIPRKEIFVSSTHRSTGSDLNSEINNPDHSDFSGNFQESPLMTTSRRSCLKIIYDRAHQTCHYFIIKLLEMVI